MIDDKIKSTIDNYDVKEMIHKVFKSKFEELSKDFDSVAALLYNMINKD